MARVDEIVDGIYRLCTPVELPNTTSSSTSS